MKQLIKSKILTKQNQTIILKDMTYKLAQKHK